MPGQDDVLGLIRFELSGLPQACGQPPRVGRTLQQRVRARACGCCNLGELALIVLSGLR